MHREEIRSGIVTAMVLWGSVNLASAASMGTAFTYQGHLENPPGTPVNASCDFRFNLFDVPAGGSTIGNSPQTMAGVAVTGGVFTTTIDFGAAAINGTARWLDISVKCPGDADFVPLAPRAELRPAPHALALPGLYTQQNLSSPNLIGGLHENTVSSGVFAATISGGGLTGPDINRVTDNFGTIGGGCTNRAGDAAGTIGDRQWATVGGGFRNIASGQSATIAGGELNAASGGAASVAGGASNTASGQQAAVGGGAGNTASGARTAVGGGESNQATAILSTVGGGSFNAVHAGYSTIGGGNDNSIGAGANIAATICGGTGNMADGEASFIGGGDANIAVGLHSLVVGGQSNEALGVASGVLAGMGNSANGSRSDIVGGHLNQANGDLSSIGGGFGNRVDGQQASIGGGGLNVASGNYCSIGGGQSNAASMTWATVAGGFANAATGEGATIGGGYQNTATGQRATIGGGEIQTAGGTASTIAGGIANDATGPYSAIGGGTSNISNGGNSTIGGGESNETAALWSTVGGGINNTASADAAAVPGGRFNQAGGQFSLAAGNSAKVRDSVATGDFDGDEGTFVWADSTDLDFVSTGPNQFLVRASGGVGVNRNNPVAGAVDVSGNVFVSDRVGIRRQYADCPLQVDLGNPATLGAGTGFLMVGDKTTTNLLFDSQQIMARNNGAAAALSINPLGGNVGVRRTGATQPFQVGTNGTNGNGAHVTVGGAWTNGSSREFKKGFQSIDKRALLEKVADLPVTQWEYEGEDGVTHIGPVAEDFRAAFRLGHDDRYITTIDADGVALAAIQGLHQLVREKDCEIENLKSEISNLKSDISEISKLQVEMSQLRALLQMNGENAKVSR